MLYGKILEGGRCRFVGTCGTSRKKWLELRRTGIGGSDAGAIMGLNKYATPLSVYLDKKGLSRFEGNAATEWGNILEDPIRQKARGELGIQIEAVPGMFTSVKHPFMNANLDGLVLVEGEREIAGSVVSGLGGHEIKTSRTGDGFTEDEIPDSYYCQVQHYMAVTGLPYFILTVYIMDRYEGRHYVIPRNDKFIEQLVKAEEDFWNDNILANNPPAPTGNESEADLVKSLPAAESIQLGSDSETVIDKLQEVKARIKELEADKTALEESVKLAMFNASDGEDAERTTAVCGAWRITWNKQTLCTVDSDALKKAGLYDTFSKKSVSKVMRISANK